MRTGRPKVELMLTDEERLQLESFARSRSLPAALSNRVRLVLASAAGEANNAIAARLKLTNQTVGKWRKRFIERGIAGLYDDVRPGPARTIDDERVAHLIKTTLHTKPANGSTHWSVRTVAAETGISKTSVQRYFQLFGLQPHRTEGFKLSNDPFFIEKLRDVVGLYLSPPDNALVICVDEKSQCQALERTQPMLPMGFGYVEGVTHDYKRHGTTTLFAALNVLNGAVLAACKPRHRQRDGGRRGEAAGKGGDNYSGRPTGNLDRHITDERDSSDEDRHQPYRVRIDCAEQIDRAIGQYRHNKPSGALRLLAMQ